MSDNRYFFVNDDKAHEFDEVAALIFAGSLIRDTLIWKEGTPDWIKIKDCHDFDDIFAAYKEEAKELMDKAMGRDKESLENNEMREFLADAEKEESSFEQSGKSWKSYLSHVTILLFVLLGSVALLWGYTLYQNRENSEQKTIVQQKKEELNLNNLRFASGVTKLDSIKGITVKRVARREEDTILREALIAERKEALAKEPKKKKAALKRGLFDKVSDDELVAFRQRLLSRGQRASTHKVKVRGKAALSGDELSSKQVTMTIKRFEGTVRSCYNKSLKNDPHLRGRMEVTIHVLGSGKVVKVVNNTSKFRGGTMDRCVRTTIMKKWKFPKFNGTLSTVTIPFILSRSN
ncbi:DUF4339 domain-containing protein [bacterium]|nr:DUF4339 domain-containing protein [bacterium]